MLMPPFRLQLAAKISLSKLNKSVADDLACTACHESQVVLAISLIIREIKNTHVMQ
jgi:hypothetical protein